MDRRAAASSRRAARRSAARARSTATSTIAASAWTSTPGRSSATAAGAIADVLPYFKRLERRVGDGDDDLSRPRRRLTVTDIDWRHPLCEAFIEGAVELGIPRNPDYNGAIQEGVSYAQRTIQNGRRVSAATRVPASGDEAAERHGAHSRACHRHRASRASARSACAMLKGGSGGTPIEVRAPARGDPLRRHLQFAAAAAVVRHRPGRRCCSRSASRCAMRSPASARTCTTTTRRASSPASRTSSTINERARGLRLVGEVLKWAFTRKGILSLSPDPGLLLLALRREHRELRPAAHLHAGELQGGRAGPARARARHDVCLLAAAARRAAATCASARPIRSRRRSSSPTIWPRRATAACCSPA